MDNSQKLLIIGLGKMGSSLLRGLLSDGSLRFKISVLEPFLNEANIKVIKDNKISRYSSSKEIKIFNFDIIILAVKPQIIRDVCEEILSVSQERKAYSIISILAGTKIKTLESFFPDSPIVRGMPNLAASASSSITAIFGNKFTDKKFEKLTENIFSKIGEYFWIKNENDMDIITAISGSGPAYYFYLTECLDLIANEMGLNQIDSIKLSKMVAKGSSDIMMLSKDAPNKLRDSVSSKGGTTEAAFEILEGDEKPFYNILLKAVKNAVKRSRELND